jgi:hypothetical protein
MAAAHTISREYGVMEAFAVASYSSIFDLHASEAHNPKRLERSHYSFIWGRARLGFFPLPFAQSHPGPSAILVDEFDAGAFKGSSNDIKGGATRLTRPSLQLVHGYDSNSGFICKLLLAPSKKSSGCPGLLRRNHPGNHLPNE